MMIDERRNDKLSAIGVCCICWLFFTPHNPQPNYANNGTRNVLAGVPVREYSWYSRMDTLLDDIFVVIVVLFYNFFVVKADIFHENARKPRGIRSTPKRSAKLRSPTTGIQQSPRTGRSQKGSIHPSFIHPIIVVVE